MFETSGTLGIAAATSSLVLLVLLPLLFAAIAGMAAARGKGSPLAMRVAIASSGGTLGLALLHAVRALQSARGQFAYQHVATLARIGHLDVAFDLVRTKTSATVVLLAAFVGFVAVLHVVWTAPAVSGRLAWTGVATSAAILVGLSDGLPTLAMGLQIGAIAGWALSGEQRWTSSGLVLAIVGDVAFVGAFLVLFWSLGGVFTSSGFVADSLPRFAIVEVAGASRADGKAALALTTYEGATLRSDDGPPLPDEPIASPFARILDPGIYSFRLQLGAATADAVVPHVSLAAGRSYVLTPYGPTTSLRSLDDQLSVARPSPSGPRSTRFVLATRTILGVGVTMVVGLLVVLAALLRLASLSKMAHGGLVFALEAIGPVVLVLHVVPLFDPRTASVLASVSAAAAVVLASDAASSPRFARVPGALLAALGALAMTSALMGESAAAIVILLAASLGAAAATIALQTDVDARWLGVAAASLAGVLPGAGTSTGIASAVAGAFAASSAGAVVAPLVVVTTMLIAFASFDMYNTRVKIVGASSSGPSVLVVLLASGSLVGGALLGVGSSPFGGKAAPLARHLVEAPGGHDHNARAAAVALVVSLAAAAVGVVAARRTAQASRTMLWLAMLAWPQLVMARIGRAIAAVARLLVRGVNVLNEDVIEDVVDVAASMFAWIGRVIRLVGGHVGGAFGRVLGGADPVVERARLDDSQRFEFMRTALVIGMAAVLGLLVVSAWVVG